MATTTQTRPPRSCPWPDGRPLMQAYHDEEWGVPLHEDRRIFEFLVLESMQAGLSWWIVLRKREAFRRAFAGFDPERVARFGARDLRRLLGDEGIIRNRAKLQAAMHNARVFLELQVAHGTFDRYVWRFVDGRPVQNAWRTPQQLPATTPASDAMSRELKARGFKFLGSTVCYAHMQAAGMVNDHLVSCVRHRAVARMR